MPNHVLVSQVGDEAVILNLTSERYFGLDSVGARMWTILSETESVEQAQEKLLSEYDVEPALLRNDLEQLIEKLVEHGVLEVKS